MRIIPVDPGLAKIGIACFLFGVLHKAEGEVFPGDKEQLARKEKPPVDPRVYRVVNWAMDRIAHYIMMGSSGQNALPQEQSIVVIEIPPPFSYYGKMRQWDMEQIVLVCGGLHDRLTQFGIRTRYIYPLQWKDHRETAEGTVRRVKQAIATGAVKALPGLEINKQPPDIWTAIGIGHHVSSNMEFEARCR